MIKLELILDDIDYDALVDRFLPYFNSAAKQSGNPALSLLAGAIPPAMLKKFVHSLPQHKKDEMAANLMNANAPRLMENAREAMDKFGVTAKIVSAKAEAE